MKRLTPTILVEIRHDVVELGDDLDGVFSSLGELRAFAFVVELEVRVDGVGDFGRRPVLLFVERDETRCLHRWPM